MKVIKVHFLILLSFLPSLGLAQVTFEESRKASIVIGKWLSKATSHQDFLSATSVATKRAGSKFFGIPDMQMASDYGYSYAATPRDQAVTEAYETIGVNSSQMSSSLALSRFHLNLGFNNKHDFTFSYLTSPIDEVRGWGVGYKRVVSHVGYFYLTYRLHYAQAEKNDYFESSTMTNDLSVSVYLRLIDLYAGVRHSSGKVNFQSSMRELKLPEVSYFSTMSEIEKYGGVVLALTTNSRLTLEVSTLGEATFVAGKLSMHFDSILPTNTQWFQDPRLIKQ